MTTVSSAGTARRGRSVPRCGCCGRSAGACRVTPDVQGEPHLSDAEIRERMSGNLCRCGAYVNIVAAIRDAQQADLTPAEPRPGGSGEALHLRAGADGSRSPEPDRRGRRLPGGRDQPRRPPAAGHP
ncbi:2Fe-2S iron-sulfur cluster-binding protein [Deinococcus sp. RM]|uniref:2Fe-2S iron-sulfur cluster-binding protein n=1 Tax=Deinococcus sp. RM TaxID=2316359 RepID=UPI003AB7BA35